MTTSYHTSKQNTTPISIPYSIKVHSQLAQVIISGKEFTRAYALWTVLRSSNTVGHIDKQSVIDLAMLQTGKAQSTVYNWLFQGEGIFWNSNNGRLWLIRKEKVFDHFLGEDTRPGKVILVPAELVLTGRLHVVRSNLSATWVSSDFGKIMSRVGRRNVFQGVPERTQVEYDKTSDVIITPIIIRSQKEKNQLPNKYSRPTSFTTLHYDKRPQRQFYGYRAVDFNMGESAKVNNDFDTFPCVEKHLTANNGQENFDSDRIYFSNVSKASEVVEYRKLNQISIPVYYLSNSNDNNQITATWLH